MYIRSKGVEGLVILGIDPGYAIVGWGVIDYQGITHRPVAFGAITTQAHTEFNSRLKQIYDDMVELIEKSKPDVMSIENARGARRGHRQSHGGGDPLRRAGDGKAAAGQGQIGRAHV